MKQNMERSKVILYILIGLFLCGGVFYITTRFSRRPSLTFPQEQPSTAEEKIIASEATVDECRVKVTTTNKEFYLDTDIDPKVRCYQYLLNEVSPSGKFVVFEDLSGGVDSILRVYWLAGDDTIRLDFFGTSKIFDIRFLPDDKLVVLYGYKGVYNEQYLKIFDLSGLFKNYPDNIHQQYKIFTDLSQHSKKIVLPPIGKDYFSLGVIGGKLKIYGTQGINAGALGEYEVGDLAIDSSRILITKEGAVARVRELAEVKSYLTRVINSRVVYDHESPDVWVIHVYEIKDGHTATMNWFKVNKETGEITKEFNF